MDKSLKKTISERRRELQNPYAFIEYLEDPEYQECAAGDVTHVDPRISEARRRMENQYAFLDGEGGYTAEFQHEPVPQSAQAVVNVDDESWVLAPDRERPIPGRIDRAEIEQCVQALHRRIWKQRRSLWTPAPPANPIAHLDPAVALKVIGYTYVEADGLGQYRTDEGLVEAAGQINRNTKTVQVSARYALHVRRFTAAHELGHAILHPTGGGVHRDRPLDGASGSRNPAEREADQFASWFLMPTRLLTKYFSDLYGTTKFTWTDETAHAVLGLSVAEATARYDTLRKISRLLAKNTRYHNRYFRSLSDLFGVSIEAMAIRLEELGLCSLG